MADLDKIYEMTVESNTNIKHIMKEQKEHKLVTEQHGNRLTEVENVGKKTIKEHMVSFGKVCGAFLIIGGAGQLLIKIAGKLWQ